jgi:exodeoxyribonuclease-3
MIVATWNVNSLKVRLEHLQQWVAEAKPDVVCLQETKCVDEQFPAEFLRSLGFEHLAYTGQKTYNGVAILSKLPIANVQVGFVATPPDEQRRLIRADVGGVRIFNAYVPNGQAIGSDKFAYKLNWLAQLRQELDAGADPSTPVLLCGDMNIAPGDRDVWDPFEAEGEILFHPHEKAALAHVLGFGLHDAYRHLKPDGKEYSWWDYRMLGFQKNRGFRIDHIFVSPPLLTRCREVVIWRHVRKWDKPSDHVPVAVRLDP